MKFSVSRIFNIRTQLKLILHALSRKESRQRMPINRMATGAGGDSKSGAGGTRRSRALMLLSHGPDG